MRVDPETAESNIETRVVPDISIRVPQVARIQGCVIVHAEIGKDGVVEHAKAVSGHPLFLEQHKVSFALSIQAL